MQSQTRNITNLFRNYWQYHSVFSTKYIKELQHQVLSSPCLHHLNSFGDAFGTNYGFAVTFKRSGISEFKHNFPFLEDYSNLVLKEACNAFYFNVLIIEAGNSIAPHVDMSLSKHGRELTIPNLVSVFYIQVPPDMEGGELILQAGKFEVGKIIPQENSLTYFRGNLTHSVNQVKKVSQPRISLVCEQYTLQSSRLEKIPNFQVLSKEDKGYEYKNEQ
ncbi:2OG-Fe(II) oxygenase [Cylindrospermum sp. FACHB-282]|uniref:2OG-Fe(II) oxygenase n=1 Tax=Cylindrospermum sp. FACHB-282 TaxID=2692794 RepID=UPI0016897BBB|nr:2OG-Fe(II) oxygenase [Cylindrospermum sp. FACHB-282]MBD2387081.1 2OG-Fe(II) oxygenase [Cylindrospermum sp. FACHB-282]